MSHLGHRIMALKSELFGPSYYVARPVPGTKCFGTGV